MPWEIVKSHPSCPTSRPWGVVKQGDGELEGCHPSEADAQKQTAALYAAEPEMNRGTMTVDTRTAVASHSTGTTDAPWDGNAAETALTNNEENNRLMYAWQDPDADPDTRAGWRFPHHMVSGGRPGAANTHACSTAIAVLNGARGGTNIPAGDRRGVYNHLAKHLRDADMEPPDLRSGEHRRRFPVEETRDDGDGLTLAGYASLFEEPYAVVDWLGSYTEVVRPGAFRKTLREKGSDVRLLVEHAGTPLARTKSKTMTLEEDDRGLRVEARLDPGNPKVAELASALRRRDVDQMSIGFAAVRQEWNAERTERALVECRLYDVSIVAFPSSPGTTVGLRVADWLAELERRDPEEVLAELRSTAVDLPEFVARAQRALEVLLRVAESPQVISLPLRTAEAVVQALRLRAP